MFIYFTSFKPQIDQIPGRETAGKVGTESTKPDNFTAQRVCGFQLHPDPADHFAEKHGRGEVLYRPLATSRLAERVRKWWKSAIWVIYVTPPSNHPFIHSFSNQGGWGGSFYLLPCSPPPSYLSLLTSPSLPATYTAYQTKPPNHRPNQLVYLPSIHTVHQYSQLESPTPIQLIQSM